LAYVASGHHIKYDSDIDLQRRPNIIRDPDGNAT